MIKALHRLLPASISLVRNVSAITADNVLKALQEQGIGFNLIRLGAGDWELQASELTDDEIFAQLHMKDAGHKGELLICTEACTRYGHEPYRCDAMEVERFISSYNHEMFFDGDVVIICEASRTVTVYHHAGAYAHVRL